MNYLSYIMHLDFLEGLERFLPLIKKPENFRRNEDAPIHFHSHMRCCYFISILCRGESDFNEIRVSSFGKTRARVCVRFSHVVTNEASKPAGNCCTNCRWHSLGDQNHAPLASGAHSLDQTAVPYYIHSCCCREGKKSRTLRTSRSVL